MGLLDTLIDSRENEISIPTDPLAQQTNWKPLKEGGTNFKTHKLHQIDHNRLVYKPSVQAWLFAVSMIVTPVLVGAFYFQDKPQIDEKAMLFLIGVPILFMVVGGYQFYKLTAKIVFDKRKGIYFKGRKEPGYINALRAKGAVDLSKVGAIQLISEYIKQQKGGSYYSHELNLVMDDGSRHNVIDHGSASAVHSDAQLLSQFLNVPVWDCLSK